MPMAAGAWSITARKSRVRAAHAVEIDAREQRCIDLGQQRRKPVEQRMSFVGQPEIDCALSDLARAFLDQTSTLELIEFGGDMRRCDMQMLGQGAYGRTAAPLAIPETQHHRVLRDREAERFRERRRNSRMRALAAVKSEMNSRNSACSGGSAPISVFGVMEIAVPFSGSNSTASGFPSDRKCGRR